MCNYYICDISLMWITQSCGISSTPLHFHCLVHQCLDHADISFDVIGRCEKRLNDKNYLHKTFLGVVLHNISLQLPHTGSLFIKVIRLCSHIAFLFILHILSMETLQSFSLTTQLHRSALLSVLFFPTVTKPTGATLTSAS